jgi:hypothetical protein
MPRDVNRNPRRWVDESGRILVIEGWHPSDPSTVGFNVKVDGDWLGTFETLEDAGHAAAAASGNEERTVVLRLYRSRAAGRAETGLHLVRPISTNDS